MPCARAWTAGGWPSPATTRLLPRCACRSSATASIHFAIAGLNPCTTAAPPVAPDAPVPHGPPAPPNSPDPPDLPDPPHPPDPPEPPYPTHPTYPPPPPHLPA